MQLFLHACSAPRLAWQIATSLQFAPALRQLAAQVASRVSATGYNGLHLRVEEDMHQYTGAEGGVEVCHRSLAKLWILDLAICWISVHTSSIRLTTYDVLSKQRWFPCMQRMYAMYADAMRALNFTVNTTAYVSSGLFAYDATGEAAAVCTSL